jgi:hypothetical protein
MVTNADVLNLFVSWREVSRSYDTIRSIIDDDPIDLPKLEAGLREALAATERARVASAVGERSKRTDSLLDGYEDYLRMLLSEIVGEQH